MTRRNALMEYLDQVRKQLKSGDYIVLHTIDSVFDALPFIEYKVLLKHKEIIDDICTRYHKPNPLHYDHRSNKREEFYAKKYGLSIQEVINKKLKKQFKGNIPSLCFGGKGWNSCGLTKFGVGVMSKYVDSSLTRCEMVQKDATWAIFEIVDLMYERPELVNEESLDSFLTDRINYVCDKYRKDNPLKNGVRHRFGKFWRGDDGKWHKERRKRF